MNIAIIDAEIIGKKKHRFPNLACMKISAYHKSIGDNVSFREFCIANGLNSSSYKYLSEFEKLYPWFGRFFDIKFEEHRLFSGGV